MTNRISLTPIGINIFKWSNSYSMNGDNLCFLSHIFKYQYMWVELFVGFPYYPSVSVGSLAISFVSFLIHIGYLSFLSLFSSVSCIRSLSILLVFSGNKCFVALTFSIIFLFSSLLVSVLIFIISSLCSFGGSSWYFFLL